MRTKIRLSATWGRVLKLGVVLIMALASGLAGLTDAAAAAPAAPRTELLSWGNNAYGELGNGKVPSSDRPVAVKMPAGVKVAQVRGGETFAVALTVGDGVFAWGSNRAGQLGIGRTKGGVGYINGSLVPVQVHLPRLVATHVAQVRAGGFFGLALTSEGQVWAWGDGIHGELGNGQTNVARLPVHVLMPGGAKIASISAGCAHSLALTTGGEVLAWGANKLGELGDGATADSDVPVRVDLPRNFKAVAVAAGCFYSLALGADGEIFAWGANMEGELGDGQTNQVNVLPVPIFVQVPGTPVGKVVQIYGGCDHTLALTSKGVVLAWGDNARGRLGITSVQTFVKLPARVTELDGRGVIAVAAGCGTSYARTSSGQELAWGDGTYGQLGNGAFDDVSTPVRVRLPAGDRATVIGAGPETSTGFVIATTS